MSRGSHEKSDVKAKPLVIWGLILVLVCVISFAIVLAQFNFYAKMWDAHGAREHRLAGVQKPADAPLIQVNEAQDLAEFRREQAEMASSYGWVDESAGIARIPVEDAKELMLKEHQFKSRQ